VFKNIILVLKLPT